MTVAALLDLGISEETFLAELSKIHVDGYSVKIDRKQKNGITGTDLTVIIEEEYRHNHDNHHGNHKHEHHNDHRNLHDIEHIIDNSELSSRVKELSKEIFSHVAKAEAKVHNKPIEDIHFHEVGAIDSLVDTIGAAICIDLLSIDEIYASPLHVGTGFVKCAHGKIPVPAPATLEILKGVPIYSRGIRSELVTPTGAAIIKALAKDFGSLPEMVIEEIGYGLGKKDLEITNILRVLKGKKKN